MCSFTVLGGSRNQSVSGVTTICLTQCSTSPSHRVDQVVDCGLWDVGPLQWLCEVAGYWQELEHAVVYTDPEHPKHAHWVTCPVTMQELGCFQLPGIVYRSLQHGAVHYHAEHEVMVMDEWHNNGPQDLVMISLCIQNAINKMHLSSLSITYACPYHNPTAAMGHLVHNVDISKPLTHTTPYTLSMRTPMRTTSLQMSFPETVSDSLCRNSLVIKPIVAAAVRVAGLRRSWRWRCWMWKSWAGVVNEGLVCGCEAGWMYCQILWNAFGDG